MASIPQVSTVTKTSHQLPLISNKTPKLTSIIIQKMKSLHLKNIKTIKKQQSENQNMIKAYIQNKKQYFKTVYQADEQKVRDVLRCLQNKSQHLSKENLQKSKKQQQHLRNYISLSKEKTRSNFLKQKEKLESAHLRKENVLRSRSKEILMKKPNYRKLYLQELAVSQQLQKKTIKKLLQAQSRRIQMKKEVERQNNGKLNNSILSALNYVQKSQNQFYNKYLQKSIVKCEKSYKLMNQLRETHRSNSQSYRKMSIQKSVKAKQVRDCKQSEMMQKLQNILREKSLKTESIHERKTKNLQLLSKTLHRNRSLYLQRAQKKSKSLTKQAQEQSKQILRHSHEEWKFLTSLKNQVFLLKGKNLYESQQVSLRA